jgi:hypothetical protein
MNKLVHNIEIKVFEKDESILLLIYKILNLILPINFKNERIIINKTLLEGIDNDIIYIISIKINKNRHNLLLLQNIFKNYIKMILKKYMNKENHDYIIMVTFS